MRVSRRDVVKAGAAGALLLGAEAVARTAPAAALLVYDSRRAASRAFAAAFGGHTIDVADEHTNRWRSFRAPLPGGRIIGLTRWSDHVLAAGYAAEQGRRLVRLEPRGGLFLWELA